MSEDSKSTLFHGSLPVHIGIIMDGNGRWAKEQRFKRLLGHQKGADTVITVATECLNLGIHYVTLYAFSEENWLRPKAEVFALMQLLKKFLKSQLKLMLKKNIRLHSIGNIEKLPKDVLELLEKTKAATVHNTQLHLILALSYGGRSEIVSAAQKLAHLAATKKISIKEIDEKLFSKHLDTADFPDPDLIIRTSGEMRLSNFLPWQSTYAEFFSSPVFWPEFGKKDLLEAIDDFSKRERRFGLTSEQL